MDSASPRTPNPMVEGRKEEEGSTVDIRAAVTDSSRDLAVPKSESWCKPHWAREPHHLLPYHPKKYLREWKQVKSQIFSGIMLAFTQVSESIAFAFIAGIGPLLGLHASWIIGLVVSLLGSTPSIINSANGVGASILSGVVPEKGVEYVFYIVLLSSMFQILAGVLNISKFARFVPRTAIIGFLNGLAIVFIIGQVRQFRIPKGLETAMPADDGSCVPGELKASGEWRAPSEVLWMLAIAAFTIVLVLAVPRIPKVGNVLPAALVGLMGAVGFEYAIVRPLGYCTPSIGDLGKMDGGFPKLFFLDPQYEGRLPAFDWDLIESIVYPAFLVAAAGVLEMVMTIDIISDMVKLDAPHPNHEIVALGIGNVLCGLFGTMGGGPCIGLCMINCHNGSNGRYRISGIVASMGVLTIVLVGSTIIKLIPNASLVGVMIMVIYHTFEWHSLRIVLVSFMPRKWRDTRFVRKVFGTSNKISRVDAIVIVLVSSITLVADIFTAVMIGAFFTAAAFAWFSGRRLHVSSEIIKAPPSPEDAEAYRKLHAALRRPKLVRKCCKKVPMKGQQGSSDPQCCGAYTMEMAPLPSEGASEERPSDDNVAEAAGEGVTAAAAVPANADASSDNTTEEAPQAYSTSHERKEDHPNTDVTAIDIPKEPQGTNGTSQSASLEPTGDSGELPMPELDNIVKVYRVHGPLLFTSAVDFIKLFDYENDPSRVEIHFRSSQVDDYSALYALNVVAQNYRKQGCLLHLRHLNEHSTRFMKKAEGLHVHFTYTKEIEAGEEFIPNQEVTTHLHVEEEADV